MTKKSIFILVACIMIIAILGISIFYVFYSTFSNNSASSQEEHAVEQTNQPSPTNHKPTEQVDTPDQNSTEPDSESNIVEGIDPAIMEQVQLLTLDEKIGQLIIAGIDGTEVDSNTKLLLNEYKIGNLIMFKRNLKNEQQITRFTTALQQYQNKNIPLWISIDQEGGIVNRLPEAYPSAEELGKKNSLKHTEEIGNKMGEALHGLGFQMDFAPVLDINSNPKNPIIGSRSFGNNADIVNAHSTAIMKALQAQGIIAIGKHFPGHGDTNEDSHLTLPAIDKSWDELMELELLPFIHAIEENIDGIMVSHLFVQKVDPQYPASLSYEFITNKLRKQLNFSGLIITDDLEMQGITNDYTVGEAAVLAIQAGADMIIIGHQFERQQDAIEQIKLAIDNGSIDIEDINTHVYRILSYKLDSK